MPLRQDEITEVSDIAIKVAGDAVKNLKEEIETLKAAMAKMVAESVPEEPVKELAPKAPKKTKPVVKAWAEDKK